MRKRHFEDSGETLVMLGVLDQPFFKSEDKAVLVVDLHELLKVEPAPFDFMLVDGDAQDTQAVMGHLAALLHEAVETPEYADSLKMKVLKSAEFAHNSSGDMHGRKAIDHACPECKQAMQAALQFLERFQVHRSLHVSATAVVLEATDLVPGERTIHAAKGTSNRVALKGMRELKQVLAELNGRDKIDSKCAFF